MSETKKRLEFLSERLMRGKNKYKKFTEDGIMVPKMKDSGKVGEDGKPIMEQETHGNGSPVREIKRYTELEFLAMLEDTWAKMQAQQAMQQAERFVSAHATGSANPLRR